MFQSATVKLTAWYLTILVAISLLFSAIIYTTASNEVNTRIQVLRGNLPEALEFNESRFDTIRNLQVHEAEGNLLMSLAVTNICIWIAGGIGSYYLARRSLRPIEEAHEAQSRFTSDASHELRTPLATMKTELEVALRDPHLKTEEMHELLVSNLEEVDKLSKLAQNLLQLSRLEHEDIQREKVSLKDTIASIAGRYDKTGMRVKLPASSKPHLVIANQASVEELLTILLDNALKYSPDNSQITIHLIRRRQMAGFEISNEGKGIAPEVLPHIFDRFFRVDTSRTSDGGKRGYGLGLSLAKKLVELNDGELTASSGKNQLTTFRVLLPIFSKNTAKNQ